MNETLEARLARRRRPEIPDAERLLARACGELDGRSRRGPVPGWSLVAGAAALSLLVPWLPASSSAPDRARRLVDCGLALVQALLQPLEGDRR